MRAASAIVGLTVPGFAAILTAPLRALVAIAIFACLLGVSSDDALSQQSLTVDQQQWINEACPRALGPSLWSDCINREMAALLNMGDPGLSDLSASSQQWISESCPRALGPSLYGDCTRREVEALRTTGWPTLDRLSQENQSWIMESCPRALGPSLWRDCAARELTALGSPIAVPPVLPAAGAQSASPRPSTAAARGTAKKLGLDNSSKRSAKRREIPLQNEAGIFIVPVTINNTLPLDFILDSGAADVSIPADVVMTLVRTKTLTETDFMGQQVYTLADGTTVPSQMFRIRSLKVGDFEIQNVTGSIANVKGSLLLGQSFLRRLGKWSIDNQRHVLVIESTSSAK